MLLDSWSEHLSYPKLRQKLIDDWAAKYGGDKEDQQNKPRRADAILIEEKGSGIALVQEIRGARIPVLTYNPGKADKISRAHQVAPLIDAKCVYLLESRKNAGECITWARDFVKQCEQFPNAEHDDYVDTFTQALIYFRDSGMLELPDYIDDEPETRDYSRKKGNPYAR